MSATRKKVHTNGQHGELLVALLKQKSDLAILQVQGWYRIPIKHAPKPWPPKWLAFYQPKSFGDQAYQVHLFGRLKDYREVKRYELFPNEMVSAKSGQLYYRIELEQLEERTQPIISTRPRRLVFIPTTWNKFENAEQINDLFNESPLEDHLWQKLKKLKIGAERQWGIEVRQNFYRLDFAMFCQNGQIDIETDGDTWHAQKERIPLDNQRDNALQTCGWHVLRFNGQQIREDTPTYCLHNIEYMINQLGGLVEDKQVSRVFYPQGASTIQQLSLFENPGGYEIEAIEFGDKK